MNLQLIINGISLGAVYALIAVGFAIVFSVLSLVISPGRHDTVPI